MAVDDDRSDRAYPDEHRLPAGRAGGPVFAMKGPIGDVVKHAATHQVPDHDAVVQPFAAVRSEAIRDEGPDTRAGVTAHVSGKHTCAAGVGPSTVRLPKR